MRFVIDAQLPPALARKLSELGHVAEHVIDIGPSDASDRQLWQYALEHEAILVTKDEDFRTMQLSESPAPVVVWIRVGNTRRAELLEWFEPLLPRLAELIAAGNALIELR